MAIVKSRPEAREKPARPNLVGRVGDELRRAILAGEIKAGQKLPSEAKLTGLYSVSRTVVREAVASLRADGLVEARQGAGVFVLSNQQPLSNPLQLFDTARISSIIEVLELRAAVEMEAAALAAVRRSPAQEEAILERCDDIDKLIADGQPTMSGDFALHLAIADATNNPRFREFLEMMGRKVIPRSSLQDSESESTPNIYLAQIQAEHRRIAEAVSARDAAAAREAMQIHLMGSQQRYRLLLRGN
jgi:GntR family transcriptional regulator, transcriptional repressor for pyruvate dehydrogenase complex